MAELSHNHTKANKTINPPETHQFGTGRIAEIVDGIESLHGKHLASIPWQDKLAALCSAMCVTTGELDETIANNSPVLRTVKGHAFEAFFDKYISGLGFTAKEVGGDTPIDREINGRTLQLKTPTEAGTRGTVVQYKTHKTHGAKSEQESMSYYHTAEEFADFLVGLVSYSPLRILYLTRNELPRHPKSHIHIKSPLLIDWQSSPALNAIDRLGISVDHRAPQLVGSREQPLPLTSRAIGVDSEVIVEAIVNRANFRIWDMSIRGFLRESRFQQTFKSFGIEIDSAQGHRPDRSDKADFVISTKAGKSFLQLKGVSTNNCDFTLSDPVIATETQLTRGRVNDHPTQSRLYLVSDFDTLILVLDPPIVEMITGAGNLRWGFYAIPVSALATHRSMPHRLASLQKFKYSELKRFELSEVDLRTLSRKGPV